MVHQPIKNQIRLKDRQMKKTKKMTCKLMNKDYHTILETVYL